MSEKYYLKKMADELRQEIDKEIIEDMLSCSKHEVCNCSELECKDEIKDRMNVWDTEDVIDD